MTMGCCMTLMIALALAGVGSGHRMISIVDVDVKASGAVGNLENHSGSAPHFAPVSTHDSITPANQDGTRQVLAENMSNVSLVTVGVTHSTANMPITSSFIEHGQSTPSVSMSRHHEISQDMVQLALPAKQNDAEHQESMSNLSLLAMGVPQSKINVPTQSFSLEHDQGVPSVLMARDNEILHGVVQLSQLAEQSDAGRQLADNRSTLSLLAVSMPHSKFNVPATSSFMEYGQGALSVLMSDRQQRFVIASCAFAFLLLTICFCCCEAFMAEADFQQHHSEEQPAPYRPFFTLPEAGSFPGSSRELRPSRRHRLKNMMKSWVSWAQDDAAPGDKETSADRVAQTMKESIELDKARYARISSNAS